MNHALPRHPIASARVRVHLAHAPEPSACLGGANRRASRERQASMAGVGRRPNISTARRVEQLHEASRLTRRGVSVDVARRTARSRDRTASSRRRRPHRGARASMSAQKRTARRPAPSVRRRAASDAPTEHLPIFLGGNEPGERADSRQHLSRRHPGQHRRCGICACQLSRRGRALVRAPRTGGRADAGHAALLLERSARSDAGRDGSSRLLLPFPRCHDRPARVAL